jgi:2-methylcitrate dehydratase PrpD
VAGTPDLTSAFAVALAQRASQELPSHVAHEARRSLLNVLGATLQASRGTELEAVVRVAAQTARGVAVPGRRELLELHDAALAIGLAGHREDFDDTHPATVIHASASTLGAVYALARAADADTTSVLRAMALGIESQLRVGVAMTPSHYDIGWHITGTCGVVGAAVAAAVLQQASPEQLGAAIRLAANFSIGHREAFGTPVKPYHSGKAAANGILAAELAALDVGGDAPGLDAPRGYFALLSDAWSPEYLQPQHVRSSWVLLENTYKAYPGGLVTHPGSEAAIALHRQLTGDPVEEIADIVWDCHPFVVELTGRPTARTGLEARFCARHGVAVGLLYGKVGLAEFTDERAQDPAVEALRSRTSLVPNPSMAMEAGRVTLRLRDGTELTHTVDGMVGSAQRPLTDDQLREKFASLAEDVIPGRAMAVADAVLALGIGASWADVVRGVTP